MGRDANLICNKKVRWTPKKIENMVKRLRRILKKIEKMSQKIEINCTVLLKYYVLYCSPWTLFLPSLK